eukprot:scaffold225460_cov17-Tisochrysis_lutea.AAC.1
MLLLLPSQLLFSTLLGLKLAVVSVVSCSRAAEALLDQDSLRACSASAPPHRDGHLLPRQPGVSEPERRHCKPHTAESCSFPTQTTPTQGNRAVRLCIFGGDQSGHGAKEGWSCAMLGKQPCSFVALEAHQCNPNTPQLVHQTLPSSLLY